MSNKTIHELDSLSEITQNDEMLIYDISAGADNPTKKVTVADLVKTVAPRFPDYERGNIYTTAVSSYTCPEDVYIEYCYISGAGVSAPLFINNKEVTVMDQSSVAGSSLSLLMFTGYCKKGDIITRGGSNIPVGPTKIFGLK